MLFVDTQLQMDEAVWDADDGSAGAIWQLEAEGAIRASSILIGQQTWYGTDADAKGFKGIISQLSLVVKGSNTSTSTSAYLVWMDGREGVRYDVGKDGNFAISAPFRQQVLDADGKSYFAHVGNLKSYVGLFVGSAYSAWGITGITSNSALPSYGLTDASAFQLVGGIPAARRSNLRWFFNRTSEATLRQNRSAMTTSTGIAQYQPGGSTGAPAYAPLPESLAGYPITITDSILNTETNA
jgi:hypothetical protein